ncbi:MAG TPA: hypothetical protein VGS06_13200 [Streptosporangiaceae bacterium]|nr:hypothetical protein [Streptosporangiaceae bacterium]
MPALRKGSPSVEDKVRAELALIRTRVPFPADWSSLVYWILPDMSG